MENLKGNFLSCKICLFAFDYEKHNPKVLKCGHTMCELCLSNLQKLSMIKCPFCKKENRDHTPMVNYEILSYIQSCTSDNSCLIHMDEVLNFYCKNCKKLVCQHCLLLEHMGHELAKPEDSEISKTLEAIDEFKIFSKEICQEKFELSKGLNEVSSSLDKRFENFFATCLSIKNLIKFEYLSQYKKVDGFVKELDSLDDNIKSLHQSCKKGNPEEQELNVLKRFTELRNNYSGLLSMPLNVEENKHYLMLSDVINKLSDITETIKSEMDCSELDRPEYQDIENIIDYLLKPCPSNIRYKVKASQLNQKLIKRTASHCSQAVPENVINILSSIDRKDFVNTIDCYNDSACTIGWNTTISAPHMHVTTLAYLSKVIEILNKPEAKAIDIGTGSGLVALALAKLVGPKGKVIALDHIDEITAYAKSNITKNHSNYLSRIEFVTQDGKNGYSKGAPYDIIHLGAAVESIGNEIISQLSNGGAIWAPVGPIGGSKMIQVITKSKEGVINRKELMAVSYAEMTTVEDQLSSDRYSIRATGLRIFPIRDNDNMSDSSL